MLIDSFDRHIRYLRLSVTDVCNFRCNYCLPDGYQCEDDRNFLSQSEIKHLVGGFAKLGVSKIRITGGEPSVRKDLPGIIADCKNTPGVEEVAITTNGYKLPQQIGKWIDAGLDRLNISIDSLRADQFRLITGHDRLQEVMDGIDKAYQLGIKQVKVNTVLLKQFNQNEFDDFLSWVKDKPLTLRFIELMQTGDNTEFFQQNHIRGEDIRQQLLNMGWERVIRECTAGPAQEFKHPDYNGKIGLIMPYSKDFCASCNRLRVSAKGNVHLCLFAEQGHSVREYLTDEKAGDLPMALQALLTKKKSTHALDLGYSGATKHLAMLGG